MVIRICIILLGSLLANLCVGDSDVDFRVEFSKPEIYVGESVISSFVIYSQEPILDVEVAKFPEFRGYWKENLTLRQGPIAGSPTPQGVFKIVVGTYLVVPMLNNSSSYPGPIKTRSQSGNSEIQPMKIVIRGSKADLEKNSQPHFIASKGELPIIKPLPPPTKEEDKTDFFGAVGNFNFYEGDSIVNYQKGEPTQIRLVLTGQGNFPEINTIALNLPKEITLMSKRALTQGGGPFTSKVFEYTVNVQGDHDFILEPFRFVFFDPAEKQYRSINSPRFQFKLVKSTLSNEEDASKALLLEPSTELYTLHKPWSKSLWFICLNIALAWLTLILIAAKTVVGMKRKAANNPKRKQRLQLKLANDLLKKGDLNGFLKEADLLTLDLLKTRLVVRRPGATRKELIETAYRRGFEDLASLSKLITSTYEQRNFSSSQQLQTNPDHLYQELKKLVLSGAQ